MKHSAVIAGICLVFNMVAMPFWWGGVSASGGFLGAIQLFILIGFVFVLLFDLVSTGWILTRICWIQERSREGRCQQGWLLVLAVLAMVGMMGAKVMVDEIARETPLGGAAGEWGILYICLTLQLAYIIAVLVQTTSSQSHNRG